MWCMRQWRSFREVASMKRRSGIPQRLTSLRALEAAGGKRNHQLGASGDGRPLAGRGGEQIQHRRQSAGRNQLMSFSITAHDRPSPAWLRSACCSGKHRLKDAHEAGAAAEIAGEAFTNLEPCWDEDCALDSCTAAISMPGVQIPHCAPPQSRNACCKRMELAVAMRVLQRFESWRLRPEEPARGNC